MKSSLSGFCDYVSVSCLLITLVLLCASCFYPPCRPHALFFAFVFLVYPVFCHLFLKDL